MFLLKNATLYLSGNHHSTITAQCILNEAQLTFKAINEVCVGLLNIQIEDSEVMFLLSHNYGTDQTAQLGYDINDHYLLLDVTKLKKHQKVCQ